MRAIKLWWVVLAFLSGFTLAMMAEEFILNWHNDRLEFSTTRVHFLSGKTLDLLHNAEAVPVDFQVTLFAGDRRHEFRRMTDRFVISWSLWEEKFKVVKTQSPMSSIDHLSSAEAEAWCWRQMSTELTGFGENDPFWVRVDIRAEDGKDGPLFGRGVSESGISLTGLIEIFSRPARAEQSHWGPYDAGPYTIDELKRSSRRGS